MRRSVFESERQWQRVQRPSLDPMARLLLCSLLLHLSLTVDFNFFGHVCCVYCVVCCECVCVVLVGCVMARRSAVAFDQIRGALTAWLGLAPIGRCGLALTRPL